MEAHQIAQLLTQTLSPDVSIVHTATATVDRLSFLTNFSSCLLSIAADQGLEIVCATYLKNFIGWSIDANNNTPNSTVNKDFRGALILALLQEESSVLKILTEAVRSYMPSALAPSLPSLFNDLIGILSSLSFDVGANCEDGQFLRQKTGKRSLIIFSALVTRHRKFSDKLLPGMIRCVLKIVKHSAIIRGTNLIPSFMKCLAPHSGCAFSSNATNRYSGGACLVKSHNLEGACKSEGGTWYAYGCPGRIGSLAVVFLALYVIVYSPGMGTVPWVVNSEIYLLRYRGLGGGIAAIANWSSNLIVSETFLTLREAIGLAGTFLLYVGFSVVGLVFIFFLGPETEGCHLRSWRRCYRKDTHHLERKQEKLRKMVLRLLLQRQQLKF